MASTIELRSGVSDASEVQKVAEDLGPFGELVGELRDRSVTVAAAKVRARQLGARGQAVPQIVASLAQGDGTGRLAYHMADG